MDLYEAIRHALRPGQPLEALPPNRWDPVSYRPDRTQPGQRVGRVTAHGVGFSGSASGGEAWAYFTFKRNEDGTLWATSSRAGRALVYLGEGDHDPERKGHLKAEGRVAIRPVFTASPPQAKTSVSFLYEEDGATHEYRFDGRNWP